MSEVIWDCPICKTENRDLTDETATPTFSRCDVEHEWSDLNVDNLALFEKTKDSEVTGTVHHYCSESCRMADKKQLGDTFVSDRSNGAVQDEVCSRCETAL